MTPQRAQAYGRVMKTIADMGPSKLQRREQDVIRVAADAMLFAGDEGDAHAALAVSELRLIAARLVEAERWLVETAHELVQDVEQCGPAPVVARDFVLA